jgi:hypothetical protein
MNGCSPKVEVSSSRLQGLTRWMASLVAVVILVGCGETPPSEAYGSSLSAITNSEPDTTADSVVALLFDDALTCTGSVIAPEVVLTAAHCLYSPVSAPLPDVVVGWPLAMGQRFSATRQWTHPLFDPVTHANDIALVVTSRPLPVPALSMMRASLGDVRGDAVTLVGFGLVSASSKSLSGRHEGSALVASVAATTLTLHGDPSLPCNGDSGGPVILNVDGSARIVAIISYGDEKCRDYAVATRVDAYATSFLDSFTSAGTVPTGGRCLFDGNCSQGECFAPPDAPLVAYCDAACSATSACEAPLECSKTTSGSRCRYPEPSPGAFGTYCTSASACDSAVCARVAGTQTSWCSAVCFPEDSSPCPAGYACLDNPDVAGAHACYPEEAGSAAASCAMHSAPTGCSEGGALVAVAALLMVHRRTRRPPSPGDTRQ